MHFTGSVTTTFAEGRLQRNFGIHHINIGVGILVFLCSFYMFIHVGGLLPTKKSAAIGPPDSLTEEGA